MLHEMPENKLNAEVMQQDHMVPDKLFQGRCPLP
jgi:hypothetical protein